MMSVDCCVIQRSTMVLMALFPLFILVMSQTTSGAMTVPSTLDKSTLSSCPSTILSGVFKHSVPRGRRDDHVHYSRVSDATDFEQCVVACCKDQDCNVALVYLNQSTFHCFKTSCENDDQCWPVPQISSSEDQSSSLVLVRPRNLGSWSQMSQPNRNCEVGLELEQCYENEQCQPVNTKSRNGVCVCKNGFVRQSGKKGCVSKDSIDSSTKTIGTKKSEQPVQRKIDVHVESVSIRLPETSASLEAVVRGEEDVDKLSFEWAVVQSDSQMEGSMSNVHNAVLHLKDLDEGVYSFRVNVANEESHALGVALANVTVLPAKRVNSPPKAVLAPPEQTLSLPTTKAVLDASQSTDDLTASDALKYTWQLVSAPITYKSESASGQGSMFTLTDLVVGNYSVQVKVEDEDGAEDQAWANITVLPEVDHPPTAIAGEDVVIYLPQRSVTLNGNRSSDDHGIVSWEWTLKPVSEDNKEVTADTKNMRTSHPTLSNLEEGLYVVVLTVKDAKGQSDRSEVKIYVKPAKNLPPTANAGKDQVISLPKNWVTLDGSQSQDDSGDNSELAFNWTTSKGPNKPNIVDSNLAKANATGLTKGVYMFELIVKDKHNLTASSSVTIEVRQDENLAPVAKAGKAQKLKLPIKTLVFNGSSSYDDLRVAKYKWSREPQSLAAGRIVGHSDTKAIMYLEGVVEGEYVFRLQVWDDQGKSSSDVTTVNVESDPDELDVVQAEIDVALKAFTQRQVDELAQAIALMLHASPGKMGVSVRDVFEHHLSGNAVVRFVVRDDETAQLVPGMKVVDELEAKLRADIDLLSVRIVQLDTVICQNDCSGHGKCVQATRSCECDKFWMQNFIRADFMDQKSNCEWSVIYVGVFFSFCVASALFVYCYCAYNSKSSSSSSSSKWGSRSRRGQKSKSGRRRSNKAKYSRLRQSDDRDDDEDSGRKQDDIEFQIRNSHGALLLSETDTDEAELADFQQSMAKKTAADLNRAKAVSKLSSNGAAKKLEHGHKLA